MKDISNTNLDISGPVETETKLEMIAKSLGGMLQKIR